MKRLPPLTARTFIEELEKLKGNELLYYYDVQWGRVKNRIGPIQLKKVGELVESVYQRFGLQVRR